MTYSKQTLERNWKIVEKPEQFNNTGHGKGKWNNLMDTLAKMEINEAIKTNMTELDYNHRPFDNCRNNLQTVAKRKYGLSISIRKVDDVIYIFRMQKEQ